MSYLSPKHLQLYLPNNDGQSVILKWKIPINTESGVGFNRSFKFLIVLHAVVYRAWLHLSHSMAYRTVELARKPMTKPFTKANAAICTQIGLQAQVEQIFTIVLYFPRHNRTRTAATNQLRSTGYQPRTSGDRPRPGGRQGRPGRRACCRAGSGIRRKSVEKLEMTQIPKYLEGNGAIDLWQVCVQSFYRVFHLVKDQRWTLI